MSETGIVVAGKDKNGHGYVLAAPVTIAMSRDCVKLATVSLNLQGYRDKYEGYGDTIRN